jgi:hypothetical protein
MDMGPAALSPEPVIVKIKDKRYVLTQEKDLTGGVDYQLRTVQDFVMDHSKRSKAFMESMGKAGGVYSAEKMQKDLQTMQINGTVMQMTTEKATTGKVDIDWDNGKALNGLDENLKNAFLAAKTRLDNAGGANVAEPAAERFESQIKLAAPRV